MKNITEKLLDKKYFIFDIDGTLVDSMGMWNLVDQTTIFNQTGLLIPFEDIKMLRDSVLYSENNIDGNIYDLFYQEVINTFGLNLTYEQYGMLRRELADQISINELDFKPGAGEFLQILNDLGKKIGITTTTTRRQFNIYSEKNNKMVKQAPMGKLASAIITCEDVERKKPDPEAYLKTVEKLGAKKKDCIVFEDSLSGAIAAKSAGLDVVAVYDESAKFEQDRLDMVADYKIESFDELIKALGLEYHKQK